MYKRSLQHILGVQFIFYHTETHVVHPFGVQPIQLELCLATTGFALFYDLSVCVGVVQFFCFECPFCGF